MAAASGNRHGGGIGHVGGLGYGGGLGHGVHAFERGPQARTAGGYDQVPPVSGTSAKMGSFVGLRHACCPRPPLCPMPPPCSLLKATGMPDSDTTLEAAGMPDAPAMPHSDATPEAADILDPDVVPQDPIMAVSAITADSNSMTPCPARPTNAMSIRYQRNMQAIE
ncbi:hypothetical protein PHYSODRAFT_250706 [Phytophthora sojae]|uniref:Uncharacterized protein n=1 Tax=Phytophthora sojae (strain P6497) TaxID=1094619 RepID=G4ZWC2_PHYSP|nr:hypothetical protein PHYSODRAFT_250706 [Phytophthora sojae]EGZ11649.1 hypothetical protein PHYSODRAFT_250706 [Phytophthora sojae]|eukprot:XP_009531982.1 hypothetical protein PHYSODRAFT_250706 [Phytophthora sojae]